MPTDPLLQAYVVAFHAVAHDWITPNVRVLASHYCDAPLKLSVAMLRHEHALEQTRVSVGRSYTAAKRSLLHARAQLYAAMLNEPIILPVRKVIYPEGNPPLHSKFMAKLAKTNAKQVLANKRMKYRQTLRELKRFDEHVTSLKLHAENSRLEWDRARRQFHAARQAHERSLMERRSQATSARAAPALIADLREAQARHTQTRAENARVQTLFAAAKQKRARLRTRLVELRSQLT